MWNKIRLENLIFYHAAHANRPCRGVQGRLLCGAAPAYLQALLAVYNRFFEEENRRFLTRDLAQSRTDFRAGHRQQRLESRQRPLGRNFHLGQPRHFPKLSP